MKNVVFMGRMNPPHNGHIETILDGFNMLDDGGVLHIVFGSSNQYPNYKNPFNDTVRAEMLLNSLQEHLDISYKLNSKYTISTDLKRVELRFHFVEDRLHSMEEWTHLVYNAVDTFNATIIGHDKDGAAHHLHDAFEFWDFVDTGLKLRPDGTPYNASDLRKDIYEHILKMTSWKDSLPDYVYSRFSNYYTVQMENLANEYKYMSTYASEWGTGPFEAVDALVVDSANKVLLIKRGGHPGQGSLALPGGFVDSSDSTYLEAALRELQEETSLSLHLSDYNYRSTKFDYPYRSERNINSTVFMFKLNYELSEVMLQAGDDATETYLLPLEQVLTMRNKLFNDHHHIIKTMTKDL